jgi:selenophosphate synthetase-related protein
MLSDLAQALRLSRGLAHKADIAPVLQSLRQAPVSAIRVGDDCAAIPDGDGFLLLAIEGFLQEFVESEPHFAGWSGVMVNAADIAAMGGRAVAVVDAIWSRDHDAAAPILAGFADAARTYGIPIVGGHTNTRARHNNLSVAILGRARKLLTSFDAKPGEARAIRIRSGTPAQALRQSGCALISMCCRRLRRQAWLLRQRISAMPALLVLPPCCSIVRALVPVSMCVRSRAPIMLRSTAG